MADIQLNPLGRVKDPDITGPIQVGFGIAQGRQQQQLKREKFEANKLQLAAENARVEEDRKILESERAYNNSLRTIAAGAKLNNVEMQESGFRGAMESILDEPLPVNYPIEQEDLDMLQKINTEKDPQIKKIMADELARKTGLTLQSLNIQAEKLGLSTGITPESKEIAKEGRLLTAEETLIEKRAGVGEAEIKQKADIAAGVKEAEQKRLSDLLDKAGLDPETKNRVLVAAQAGIGAPAEAALFPKNEEAVRFMSTFDKFGEKSGEVPVKTFTDPKTGKFVFEVAEKFVPEQKAQPSVAAPEPPPEAPKPEPQPEVQALLTKHREAVSKKAGLPSPLGKPKKKEKVDKLTELKHISGAPTLGEYLEFIASNPQNVDAQGNIIILEKDLIEDYSQILETQKIKNTARGKQKALRLK